MANVALVPERLVLHRCSGVAAQEAGETGDSFTLDRIALLWHCRAASLTGAERGKLRSLAQTLDPKVFVGKAGVNEGIAKLLNDAFRNADLVKVRFTAEREAMETQAQELAKLTDSEVIGSVGRTATFFRLGATEE